MLASLAIVVGHAASSAWKPLWRALVAVASAYCCSRVLFSNSDDPSVPHPSAATTMISRRQRVDAAAVEVLVIFRSRLRVSAMPGSLSALGREALARCGPCCDAIDSN